MSPFEPTFADYYLSRTDDLFDKCHRFGSMLAADGAREVLSAQYRLELLSPLDAEILVRDTVSKCERVLTCFDSNSYLGLHLHPRVVAHVQSVLCEAGYGTPSAQLLSGTNRWLRELEETVATFHGRPSALIFPSGYAANIGILTGLLRSGDLCAVDALCHASLHDGAAFTRARKEVFRTGDMSHLDEVLTTHEAQSRGRLVVADGVFSMHGTIADLPGLVRTAKRHEAYLMVDEAHSTGVLGGRGLGLEEHYGMEGSIDVLMGTFSKAPGACGGYVVGDNDLIEYLRFYARSAVFTASLPAATCAGITEAFRVMQEEPWHREDLWRNAARFHQALFEQGLDVPPFETPIVTLRIGSEGALWEMGAQLIASGIKAGSACYPAVPRGEALLRFSVNARHTAEQLDRAAEVIGSLCRKCDVGLVCERRIAS